MHLDSTQQQTLMTWLTAKGVQGCYACQGKTLTTLQTGEIIAAPALRPIGGIGYDSEIVPMVQVLCTSCAHVMHFAVAPIGLVT